MNDLCIVLWKELRRGFRNSISFSGNNVHSEVTLFRRATAALDHRLPLVMVQTRPSPREHETVTLPWLIGHFLHHNSNSDNDGNNSFDILMESIHLYNFSTSDAMFVLGLIFHGGNDDDEDDDDEDDDDDGNSDIRNALIYNNSTLASSCFAADDVQKRLGQLAEELVFFQQTWKRLDPLMATICFRQEFLRKIPSCVEFQSMVITGYAKFNGELLTSRVSALHMLDCAEVSKELPVVIVFDTANQTSAYRVIAQEQHQHACNNSYEQLSTMLERNDDRNNTGVTVAKFLVASSPTTFGHVLVDSESRFRTHGVTEQQWIMMQANLERFAHLQLEQIYETDFCAQLTLPASLLPSSSSETAMEFIPHIVQRTFLRSFFAIDESLIPISSRFRYIEFRMRSLLEEDIVTSLSSASSSSSSSSSPPNSFLHRSVEQQHLRRQQQTLAQHHLRKMFRQRFIRRRATIAVGRSIWTSPIVFRYASDRATVIHAAQLISLLYIDGMQMMTLSGMSLSTRSCFETAVIATSSSSSSAAEEQQQQNEQQQHHQRRRNNNNTNLGRLKLIVTKSDGTEEIVDAHVIEGQYLQLCPSFKLPEFYPLDDPNIKAEYEFQLQQRQKGIYPTPQVGIFPSPMFRFPPGVRPVDDGDNDGSTRPLFYYKGSVACPYVSVQIININNADEYRSQGNYASFFGVIPCCSLKNKSRPGDVYEIYERDGVLPSPVATEHIFRGTRVLDENRKADVPKEMAEKFLRCGCTLVRRVGSPFHGRSILHVLCSAFPEVGQRLGNNNLHEVCQQVCTILEFQEMFKTCRGQFFDFTYEQYIAYISRLRHFPDATWDTTMILRGLEEIFQCVIVVFRATTATATTTAATTSTTVTANVVDEMSGDDAATIVIERLRTKYRDVCHHRYITYRKRPCVLVWRHDFRTFPSQYEYLVHCVNTFETPPSQNTRSSSSSSSSTSTSLLPVATTTMERKIWPASFAVMLCHSTSFVMEGLSVNELMNDRTLTASSSSATTAITALSSSSEHFVFSDAVTLDFQQFGSAIMGQILDDAGLCCGYIVRFSGTKMTMMVPQQLPLPVVPQMSYAEAIRTYRIDIRVLLTNMPHGHFTEFVFSDNNCRTITAVWTSCRFGQRRVRCGILYLIQPELLTEGIIAMLLPYCADKQTEQQLRTTTTTTTTTLSRKRGLSLDPFEYERDQGGSNVIRYNKAQNLQFVASMLLQICRIAYLLCNCQMEQFMCCHVAVDSGLSLDRATEELRRLAPRFLPIGNADSSTTYLKQLAQRLPSLIDNRGRIRFDHQRTVDHVVGQLRLYARLTEGMTRDLLQNTHLVEMIRYYQSIADFRACRTSVVLLGDEAFAAWMHEVVRMPDVRTSMNTLDSERLARGLRPHVITNAQYGLAMLQPTHTGTIEDARRIASVWNTRGVNIGGCRRVEVARRFANDDDDAAAAVVDGENNSSSSTTFPSTDATNIIVGGNNIPILRLFMP
jgi:hypothetical protein